MTLWKWKGSYDPDRKYSSEWAIFMQKAAVGSVCKLWHHWVLVQNEPRFNPNFEENF